ncbi:MAG: EF-P lysine aminoacylase EpmA [Kiritimatiellia bacterium]
MNLQPSTGIKIRSEMTFAMRRFFHERGYLEVETPVRLPAPALETHIDAEPSGDWFLRTSPEFHMKRMLAAGHDKIFQIGPCFRRGERGDLHHPEYTMLEWYRAGADYESIMEETRELLFAACGISGDWLIMNVSDAFLQHAGWDPAREFDAVRFDMDLVDKVEPSLPKDRPVVLKDYPIEAGAFARPKPGAPHLAERWELYLRGVEIANAYSELIDADEQLARLESIARERRRMGKPVYPTDKQFIQAIKSGLPPCGGIALGIDRLAMVMAGATTLDQVMAFREE